jgi:hypothetical protein
VIEIDMRRWTMPRQRGGGGKPALKKEATPTKSGRANSSDGGDDDHNYFASFSVFLRFLYSGVMSLPAVAVAVTGDRSPDNYGSGAAPARSLDEEAALYREILGLGELLGVKALVRQVQPRVDEEARRAKKAHLLTSAF